ncbi:MAG: glycosyltransferase family 4 protein [Desulfotalea sp.]
MIHYDYHLCRALQKKGVETTLVTSTDYELRHLTHEFRVVELLKLWDPRGGKSSFWPVGVFRRLLRGWKYIREWFRLIHFLKKERPEIVVFGEIRFVFEYFFLWYLRVSGFVLADVVHDIRAYDTSLGEDTIVLDSKAHIKRYSKIYNLFHLMFVHNRTNYDDFISLYDVMPSSVIEIPFGTNDLVLEVEPSHTPEELRVELELPGNIPLILFFGTLTKYKGVEDLIRAFPAVHQNSGAHLIIAGYPTKDIDPNSLKDLASELGVMAHITWILDYIPNEMVAPLVSLATVVVLPYRAITQSGILQIAYACGRPVIGTKVGGLPDVIEDGKSGMLADPANPISLAESMNSLLGNPQLIKEMGEYAEYLAKNVYSWDYIVNIYIESFDDQLEKPTTLHPKV